MRSIFFALAALALAATAALWSEGPGVAGAGGVRTRDGGPEADPRQASEVAADADAAESETSASAADAEDGALENESAQPASIPDPLATDGDPVGGPEPGAASDDAGEGEPFETLQLAAPAPFPEEASPGAGVTPPEGAADRDGAHASAGSRGSAPFDPEWSAALVRRLLALHRTLSE
jgi:hypothetical protein